MEKKIEQYLHFYFGCECLLGDPSWKRSDISDGDRAPYTDADYGKPVKTKLDFHLMGNFKHMHCHLILRPLSDMSEQEMTEYFFLGNPSLAELNIQVSFLTNEVKRRVKHGSGIGYILKKNNTNFGTGTLSFYQFNADQVAYLLNKSFDIFGLIQAKLAISAPSQKNNLAIDKTKKL